jgi:hypothetical protein
MDGHAKIACKGHPAGDFLCDGMARVMLGPDAAVISRSPAIARIVPSDAWSVLYEDISETTRMRAIRRAEEH